MLILVIINFLSWNIRGIKAPEKVSTLKSIIRNNNLDWVGVTETKSKECSKTDINRIWDSQSIDYNFCVASQSLSGGIFTSSPTINGRFQ